MPAGPGRAFRQLSWLPPPPPAPGRPQYRDGHGVANLISAQFVVIGLPEYRRRLVTTNSVRGTVKLPAATASDRGRRLPARLRPRAGTCGPAAGQMPHQTEPQVGHGCVTPADHDGADVRVYPNLGPAAAAHVRGPPAGLRVAVRRSDPARDREVGYQGRRRRAGAFGVAILVTSNSS